QISVVTTSNMRLTACISVSGVDDADDADDADGADCKPAVRRQGKTMQPRNLFGRAPVYLSRLRRDSVGADFQSVRKLTNYVCAKPPESRLSRIHNVYYALQQYPHCGGYGY